MPRSIDQSGAFAQREMAKFLRSDPFLEVPYDVVLEMRDFWEGFDDIVFKHNIDLIVLGTHGHHGARKLLLGSIAEEVFRRAACPVLTVGPGVGTHVPSDLKRVLFATDFSSGSMHALPYALSLVVDHGAHLTLLHVLPEPGVVAAAQETSDSREREQARFQIELQKLLPKEERRNADFVVEYGFPAESILYIAAERKIELIVMGVRHAASILAATHFPWTTAHKVVSQAPCAVLTVRS